MNIVRFEGIVFGWAPGLPDVLDILVRLTHEKVGTARRKQQEIIDVCEDMPDGTIFIRGGTVADITVQQNYAECDMSVWTKGETFEPFVCVGWDIKFYPKTEADELCGAGG